MKKVFLGLMLAIFLFTSGAVAAPKIYLDGQQLEFSTPPVLENGRTLVPLREIAETAGAEVIWNAANKTIELKQEGLTIKLTINSNLALINQKVKTLEQPAVIQKGRTLVPLRFLSETWGWGVEWVYPDVNLISAHRIYLCGYVPDCPEKSLLKSLKELKQFTGINDIADSWKFNQGLQGLFGAYNWEGFWQKHYLAVIYVEVSSGSDQIASVSYQENNQQLQIGYQLAPREIGTADMSGYLIAIPVSQKITGITVSK